MIKEYKLEFRLVKMPNKIPQQDARLLVDQFKNYIQSKFPGKNVFVEYINAEPLDEVSLSAFKHQSEMLNESWRECMNQTTFKNNNQIDLIFLKENNYDRFAFLTRQEIWNGFKQSVQQKSGSKLGFTDDWIVATGAVWQNKLAKIIVANFLSEQRIKAEFFEFFCPISINQTTVVLNLKTNTLLELAQSKF